jgi:hypothetical protein
MYSVELCINCHADKNYKVAQHKWKRKKGDIKIVIKKTKWFYKSQNRYLKDDIILIVKTKAYKRE